MMGGKRRDKGREHFLEIEDDYLSCSLTADLTQTFTRNTNQDG